MPSEKYEKYGKPVAPADPNQEYMTVQETAHVLRISVKKARQLLTELGIKSRPGRAIVTSTADRAQMHEAGRDVVRPMRRPQRRRPRPAPTRRVKSAA